MDRNAIQKELDGLYAYADSLQIKLWDTELQEQEKDRLMKIATRVKTRIAALERKLEENDID